MFEQYLPYVSTYGWVAGLYLWSVATIAPWFFMLARLKNMGFTSKGKSFVRLYREFGLLTSFSVMFTAVLGVPADIVFNLTNGTLIFRELPRELMFTSRVERWSDEAEKSIARRRESAGISRRNGLHASEGEISALKYRERQGMKWKRRLNAIMDGHV